MSTIIIVRIRDGYQPPEGTPFDAVVSALNHFEIESVVSKAEGDELVKALRGLLAIVADSRGVAGYHLNGDVAEWDSFEEVAAAEAAVATVEAR